MVHVWYGKDYAIRFNSLNVTMEGFSNTHIMLPVEFADERSNDDIYFLMNNGGNPMTSEKGQMWLKENELRHTSLSVGDVIERNGRLFVRDDIGWRIIA